MGQCHKTYCREGDVKAWKVKVEVCGFVELALPASHRRPVLGKSIKLPQSTREARRAVAMSPDEGDGTRSGPFASPIRISGSAAGPCSVVVDAQGSRIKVK